MRPTNSSVPKRPNHFPVLRSATMPYVLNTPEDQEQMLAAIGAASIEELFNQVPPELHLGRALELPPAMSEGSELLRARSTEVPWARA